MPLLGFCRLLIFSKILSGIPTECQQTVWIQIRPDVSSGVICIQAVCKGCQQMTIADNLNYCIHFSQLSLTLSLLVVTFVVRWWSFQTVCTKIKGWNSESKPFYTLIVFLKELYETVNFVKKSAYNKQVAQWATIAHLKASFVCLIWFFTSHQQSFS